MSRKGMNGQLNMFDLFGVNATGEVEMVPFVPTSESSVEVVPKSIRPKSINKKNEESEKIVNEKLPINNESEELIKEELPINKELEELIKEELPTNNESEELKKEELPTNNESEELKKEELRIKEEKEHKIIKEKKNKLVTKDNESERNNSFGNKNEGIVSKVPVKYEKNDVVMHKEKLDSKGNIIFSISYVNYNKVVIKKMGEDEKLYTFDNSRDAVDFYIDEMIKMEEVK